jgi:hypothetical protein
MRHDRRGLTVAVTDGGGGLPIRKTPAATARSGRGVLIVEKLSDAWGSTSQSGKRTTVWFRIAPEPELAPSPRSGRALKGRLRRPSTDAHRRTLTPVLESRS